MYARTPALMPRLRQRTKATLTLFQLKTPPCWAGFFISWNNVIVSCFRLQQTPAHYRQGHGKTKHGGQICSAYKKSPQLKVYASILPNCSPITPHAGLGLHARGVLIQPQDWVVASNGFAGSRPSHTTRPGNPDPDARSSVSTPVKSRKNFVTVQDRQSGMLHAVKP